MKQQDCNMVEVWNVFKNELSCFSCDKLHICRHTKFKSSCLKHCKQFFYFGSVHRGGDSSFYFVLLKQKRNLFFVAKVEQWACSKVLLFILDFKNIANKFLVYHKVEGVNLGLDSVASVKACFSSI